MIKLRRLSKEPVMKPRKHVKWEAGAVFNAASIYDNGLVHLLYRTTDIASSGKDGDFISRIGYAVSKDGLHFNRLEEPVLSNDVEQERRGCEDPRIVKIDETYYMMYTGFGGRFPGDYRICLASSKNLIDWKRHGVVLDEKNKDASLFPGLIGGKYVMLHRREPDIWIAYSDDLKQWYGHRSIMKPIPESTWECNKIGIGGPPLETKDGFLLIYHGTNKENVYSLGVALLDLEDPSKVIARQKEPVLEPVLKWEREGCIPNVVFSCGQVELEDRIIVYYGGADKVIGTAEIKKDEICFDGNK
ncbi:MAG: hypothetical protein J7K04_03510 [Spirochaetales bacterium]|nr:hypothetical protein [Spirochaetales bacterium]